jgi:hypothetical protein
MSDQDFKYKPDDNVLFDPRVGRTDKRTAPGVILAHRVGLAGIYYEIRRISNGCVYTKIESGIELAREQ